jgi:predicted dinucleotide-binding enzyme
VVTVPLRSYRSIPVEPLRDKVVIDTMNYYPARDGRVPELDDESTTTSELLQAHLTESKVVKAFNNIFFVHLGELARPAGAPDRSTLPIAGDHADAKALVARLLDEIGYDVLDLGPLAEGWRIQRDTAAYGVPYAADPVNWPAGSRSIGKEELAAYVASSKRYRDMQKP